MPRGVYVRSEATRAAIGLRSRNRSPETIAKFRASAHRMCGPAHPAWRGGVPPIERTCIACGASFYVYPSDLVKRPAIFCSNRCKATTNPKGESHPSWRGGKTSSGGYVMLTRSFGRTVYEHRAIAERALGKRLPPGAQVHHFDGNRSNNTNRNLVICQDANYHRFLDQRSRQIRDRKVQRVQ